jgi:hypothetical protein
VTGSSAAAGLEEGLWLCPIEDRRKLNSPREGMLEEFSLGNYLLLVDDTGRLFREGKAVISAEVSAILDFFLYRHLPRYLSDAVPVLRVSTCLSLLGG